MDIREILIYLLYLMALALGGGLAYLLKLKIGDTNFQNLLNWIDLMINVAEGQIKGEKKGEERKAVVMNTLLETTKVKDVAILSDLVDSRVQTEINGDKKEEI